MHFVERFSITLRHNHWVKHWHWLWNGVRPQYNRLVTWLGRNGLERVINGTDPIRLLPQFRGITETYEPEVWSHLMAQVKSGDIVADVGAHVGLYTIALAKRVAPNGKVIAFEPSSETFKALQAHIELNAVQTQTCLIQAVVGSQKQSVAFNVSKDSQSHVSSVITDDTQVVPCLPLDDLFLDQSLDILKIDVEGYEEEVLKGGINLLQDTQRSPSLIYVEVHPYAWSTIGTTSTSLLNLLHQCHYKVSFLDGTSATQIDSYGEIIATKTEFP